MNLFRSTVTIGIMDVSIVIPTLNGYSLLQKTLRTIVDGKVKGLSFEVIVVDNGSTDQTLDLLKKDFPDVVTVELLTNHGFTAAVNAGAVRAKGMYLLILNNDCIFSLKDLKKLISFLKKNQSYIATQPVILTTQNIIEQIGYTVDLIKAKAHVIKNTSYDFSQWNDQKDLFSKGRMYGLSATCLLIQKDIFKKIGMLDESFHSYLEDVDLFIRLAKKGYAFAPCLEVTASHEHMATSKKMGNYKEKHDFSNWIRIIFKNYPLSFLLFHVPSLFIERLRNLSGLVKKTI